jgi:hypothetical protein
MGLLLKSVSLLFQSVLQNFQELLEDFGGDSIYQVLVIGVGISGDWRPINPSGLAADIGKVTQGRDGDLHQLGDFYRAGLKWVGVRYSANVHTHPKVSPGDHVIQLPKNGDISAINPHLLFSLPKGRLQEILVFRVSSPSGQGDFSFVVLYQFRTLIKKDAIFPVLGVKEEEHSGRHEVRIGYDLFDPLG